MLPTPPRFSRFQTLRLCLVLAVLAVALPTRQLQPTAAQQAPGCVGWTSSGTTYTTRRMQYTSDGILHLVGCGEIFTLTDVRNALGAGIVGTEPADAVQLVDATNKTWMLNVRLNVEEGATLNLIGGPSGDVNWLRLKSIGSTAADYVWIKAQNSTLTIRDTHVSSWNPTTGTYDDTNAGSPGTDENPGGGTKPRAFVVARSVMAAGRAWTPPTSCGVDGGGRDAYEARMDVVNSTVDYLGYHDSEAYGISWKVYTADASLLPPNSREIYNRADVFGTVSNSIFSQNYFGNYMFGGYCMSVTGSSYANNYWYGLDPHDDTDFLTVSGNTFTGNAGHGFICSVECDHLVLTGNRSLNNGRNGFMIHRHVNGAVIENNTGSGNGDAGLAIFDSYDAVVRTNTFEDNAVAGVRLSVGSSRNLVEDNTITGPPATSSGNGYAVYSYLGSDLPTTGTNRRLVDNVVRGNRITGYKGPVVKLADASGTIVEGNTVTAASGLTTYEFRDGQGNVVKGNTVGGKTTVNTVQSSTSQPVATTALRNPAVGQDIAIRHTPSGGATTTLEDNRSYVWTGAETIATSSGTRGTVTGSGATVTPLDFVVVPPTGEVAVSVSTWATASPYGKTWTERSTTASGSVAHTVGNLQGGQCYAVTVDSKPIGSYVAAGSGSVARISFVYAGGYAGGTARAFTVAASSASPCGTATATATATASGSPAVTQTATPTGTPTAIPTTTSTLVPTATPSSTPPTATATATAAPSPVAFTDGFETGDLSAWMTVNGLTVQSQQVLTGSFAARGTTTGSAAYAQRTLASPQTNLYYRIQFKVVTKSTIGYLLRFRTATNGDILGLNVSSAGKLSVYNRTTGVTTASTTAVSNGAWHEVELHLNQASGLVEVWYDGARVDALSATQNVGTSPIGRIELGDASTGRTFDVAFDDVALDTGFIPLTFQPEPTATSTAGPTKTATRTATAAPTGTPLPAATSTTTAVAATDTPVPATSTVAPATSTAVPATETAVPATDTPVPATDTPVPALAFTIAVTGGVPVPSGGTVTFQVCLASSPSTPVNVQFTSSSTSRAKAAPSTASFSTVGECQTATLTDLETSGTSSGQVRLRVVVGGSTVKESESIGFPGTAA